MSNPRASSTRRFLCLTAVALALTVLAGCESKTDAPQKSGAGASGEQAAPTPPQPSPQERDDGYAGQVCALYKGCYTEAGFNGNLAGAVTAEVDAKGELAGVTFSGDAPKPIESCVLERIDAARVDGYVGGTGTISCSWQGSLNNGMEMLSESWGFTRSTEPDGSPTPGAPPPAAVAPTEPTPAPAEELDPQKRDDGYAWQVCKHYKGCYKQFDFAGQAVGSIAADVDDSGQVANVTFSGEVAKPIEQCMLDTMSAVKIDGYVGGTGTISCSWTGTIHGGTEMLSQSWGFERATEPAAAGEAGSTTP